MSRETRLAMIVSRWFGNAVSSGSSIYYQTKAPAPGTLEPMRRIDEQYAVPRLAQDDGLAA